MPRRAARTVAFLLVLFPLAFAGLSIDWRGGGDARPPEIVQAFAGAGALRAGVGRATLTPPFPAPIGGFSTRGKKPFEGVLDEPEVRAMAFEAGGKRVVVASLELVLLPDTFRAEVERKLGDERPDALVLGATHTHAGPGAYWDFTIAEWAGVGPYDPRMFDFLTDRTVSAIKQALSSLEPARIAASRLQASAFGLNRARPDGPVDRTMTTARIETTTGDVLGRIVVLGVHPTIVHRDAMRLSGDWPGALRRDLETGGGVALFFQGAGGDTTWGKRAGVMSWEDRVVRFGQAVASDARGALMAAGDAEGDIELRFAEARFVVPAGDARGLVVPPFQGAVSNVLHWLAWPGTANVAYLELGPLALAFVPGEPVAELGLAWRETLGASVVGLANGYVGYVETPDLVVREEGETKRTYFGPTLAPRMLEALRAAQDAATSAIRAQ